MTTVNKFKVALALIFGPWLIIKLIQAILSLIELFDKSVTGGLIAIVFSIVMIIMMIKGVFMLNDAMKDDE